MTIAVDMGRKATKTKETNKQIKLNKHIFYLMLFYDFKLGEAGRKTILLGICTVVVRSFKFHMQQLLYEG